jgi:uncharacterized OB-fold protein
MSEPAYPLWDAEPNPALLASRDRDSGEILFPALPGTSPLHGRHENVRVAEAGSVYSYTVIHPGPKSGEAPYALGYVDFPGPVRIFGRLTGTPRPTIDERYRALPDERYGYVFVAVDA